MRARGECGPSSAEGFPLGTGAVDALRWTPTVASIPRTEAKTQADSLSVITLKPPSELGDDTLVGRIPGRPMPESRWTGSGALYSVLTLQTQEHLIRLDDEKQLVTDTAELKMTEDALSIRRYNASIA